MKTKLVALITLFIVTVSCSENKSLERGVVSVEVSDKNPLQLTAVPSSSPSKLIKTADYRFEVKNLKTSLESIEKYLQKYPSYIASSNLTNRDYILESKIVIRVQTSYFDELLKEIDREASSISYRNISTRDVSREFVDLESRLKTKREVEGRYMEILRKRTGSIKEVLEAEQQIGALHEEIEATISRINFLKDQVSYSTINIEMFQPTSNTVTTSEEPIGLQFLNAFKSGFYGLTKTLIVITQLWPLILLTVIIVLVLRVLKRNMSSIKIQDESH